jgi:hypothetical protein
MCVPINELEGRGCPSLFRLNVPREGWVMNGSVNDGMEVSCKELANDVEDD